jgi:hypothetical protein
VNSLTNLDFGNSKGLDFKLDWRVAALLSTSVAYTYQIAKGTGSDPFSYLNGFARQTSALSGTTTPPPEQAQRTDNDRTHNIAGAVALTLADDFKQGTTWGAIFRNVSAFATFRAQSGLPYTRLVNGGDGQTAPFVAFGLGGRADEPLNASVLPWTAGLDLRLNKGFRIGGMDITAYTDVRNLLNINNTVGVYAETGDVTNQRNREQFIEPELLNLAEEAGNAGALAANGSVLLTGNCQQWATPVNCEALRRVEARFGDADGTYTVAEQEAAYGAAYESFRGVWRFKGQPRHIRLGFELSF